MRFQEYGFDAAGRLTHAGTFEARVLSAGTVRKNHRQWLKWRTAYLAKHPGNYPLRHDANTLERTTVQVGAHLIGQPEAVQYFTV